jgi:hypothetical protein
MDTAMRIKGGYILLSRKLDSSEVMKFPPATRELWLYILRKVNHCDYKNIKRGENLFQYKKIQDDLCWYAGYRKITYTKSEVAKSIRRLHEAGMIATAKETRGVMIKVLQYDLYQDPKSYERNNESNSNGLRKQRSGSTIYKNVYKNEYKNVNTNIPKGDIGDKPQEFGNSDITKLQKFLKEHYPIPLEGITDRRRLHNVIQVLTKRKNQDEWMDDDWRKNFNTFINLYIPNTKEGYYARSVYKLLDKIKLWREYRGKLN